VVIRPAVGSAYNLRSAVTFYLGELQESVTNARKLWPFANSATMFGVRPPLNQSGTLYYKLGQWPIAESYLRQAISYNKKLAIITPWV